jgi:hypothetical protein
MTLFAVHDAAGMLTQANKVYDPAGYDKLLDEAGLTYVAVDTSALPSFQDWYVNVSAKELVERPSMSVEVNKTTIKAGADSALITGIPREASVKIHAVGQVLHAFDKLDADQIEISIPVPCSYTVTVELWPFKTWKTTIEAVQ